MKEENGLLRVYTRSEISVITIKNKLEINGISGIIRNDSENNFLQAALGVVDLYIQQSDFKKQNPLYPNSSKPVIDFFTE
jgi:hypothetical protein